MAGIRDNPVGANKTPTTSSRDLALENLEKRAEAARKAQAPAIMKAQLEAARKAAEIEKYKEQLSHMSAEQKAQVLRNLFSKDEDK